MQSTLSDPPDTTIIRTGSDGRLRYTPAQRGELLEAFDRSGLSALALSRQHGICYQNFLVPYSLELNIFATIIPAFLLSLFFIRKAGMQE